MVKSDSEKTSFSPQDKGFSRENDLADTLPPSREATFQDDDSSESDATATNSSEEFNWDEDGDSSPENAEKVQAKRGRRFWLAFMSLARPIRVLLISILGAAIFVTPLLIARFRFNDSPAKIPIFVWSLWLTIIWATSCATYLAVDSIPRIVILVIKLFGGKIERLKSQVEVSYVHPNLKTVCDLTLIANYGCKILAETCSRSDVGLGCPVCREGGISPRRIILDSNQSSDAGVSIFVGSTDLPYLMCMKTLFCAGIILFVEKLCLQWVAINFHQKALADRLAENHLGLRALDRLSNAPAMTPTKKTTYTKRGHKAAGSTATVDLLSTQHQTPPGSKSTETPPHEGQSTLTLGQPKMFLPNSSRLPKRRRKKMASVIVDQVCSEFPGIWPLIYLIRSAGQ